MTDQLSLFEFTESTTETITDGHKKTCANCKDVFIVAQGLHRARSYCKPCANFHKKILRVLKRMYPIPDNHRCDCCGKSEDELTVHYGRDGSPISPWRLDHCHETSEFRGWLCGNCNNGIGRFYDDPDLMRKAISYIQKNRP